MSRLNELVIEGNELVANLRDSNFDKWISESLLYVEKNYSKTVFAEFFINDIKAFRQAWFNHQRLDEGIFRRLISQVDAIKSHEEWLETQERILEEELKVQNTI